MRRISVVLPAFNAEPYLHETIASALAQTLADFELLILDNASTDRTGEIARSFRDERVHYRRNDRNLGYAGNINLGISIASGDYVAVLNADDVWELEFLARACRALDGHGTASFVHTAALHMNATGVPFGIGASRWPALSTREQAFVGCFSLGFCFASMVMRRSALVSIGPLPDGEPWGRIADSWLFLRLCLAGEVAFIDEPLVRYRVHDQSVSLEMYADGSFFRRHIAGVRDAFAWPEARRLGLSANEGPMLRLVAQNSISLLPLARRRASRCAVLRTFGEIVREAPSVLTASDPWLRLGFSLLPASSIDRLRRIRANRWRSRRAADQATTTVSFSSRR